MLADKGVFVPVKYCECIIDTGGAQHFYVLKIKYGPCKTPMRKCIKALYGLGQIDQNIDCGWLFKATLAPKPHQEHIVDICDFVWRFCVNYIPLNAVTRVSAYPIPRKNRFSGMKFSVFLLCPHR